MSPPPRPPYSFGYSTFPTSFDNLARAQDGTEAPARGGHDWIDPDLVPSWLTPFTLDARTRFTRTPEALLRRRESKVEPEAPLPPEPDADAPSWYFVMDPADLAEDGVADAHMAAGADGAIAPDGAEILPQPPLQRSSAQPWGRAWGEAAEFPGASFDAAAEASAGRAFFDDAERWIASLSDPAAPAQPAGHVAPAAPLAGLDPVEPPFGVLASEEMAAEFGAPSDPVFDMVPDHAAFDAMPGADGADDFVLPDAPFLSFPGSAPEGDAMATDFPAADPFHEAAFQPAQLDGVGFAEAGDADNDDDDQDTTHMVEVNMAPADLSGTHQGSVLAAVGVAPFAADDGGLSGADDDVARAEAAPDPLPALDAAAVQAPSAVETGADPLDVGAPPAPSHIRRLTRLIVAGPVEGMPVPAGDQDRAVGFARPIDPSRLTARFIANVWSGYPQLFGGAPLATGFDLAGGFELRPAAASPVLDLPPADLPPVDLPVGDAVGDAAPEPAPELAPEPAPELAYDPAPEVPAEAILAPPVVEARQEPVAELPAIVAAPPPPVVHLVPDEDGAYQLPPLDLLRDPPFIEPDFELSAEFLDRNSSMLGQILRDFGIRGEVIDANPGPVVTLYEFEPAPGIKSSRVIGLAADIARSMSAISARVAVVEGRNVIGIELPNRRRDTVWLRELLTQYAGSEIKAKLGLCLGKTIGGEPVNVDLARMPHLLVAGTTGSGKSVAINTMILSLLYHHTPQTCRLIMIDPKMLELSVYEGIPHLLTPVVTDPKKAIIALKWAVKEMEDRYRKMSRLAVRNIDGFNARVKDAAAKGEVIRHMVQAGFDKENGEPLFEERDMDLTPLPFIVVIVDEMADLMMVAGKEIEGAIQRLAQMARAAGIHLVMATQRPSVDVITGTIKANFPTRISFQVTSKIDSRTILGEMGAETLLGQGDMLYMAGGGRISRVHGPFVSDAEVEHVVAFLKAQGGPDYLDAVILDEAEMFGDDDDAVFDKSDLGEVSGDLYEQAVAVVLRDRKASTSYIQRRLQVGYNKAASLMERMENEGIVGPANHAGKREILSFSRPG